MAKNGEYQPRPEHKFTFGLWTVGNLGRDPFGDAVREQLSPPERVDLLGEVGAWGVNLHDNDLVPICVTAAQRDRIVCDFKKACERNHVVVPMATVNLFFHPVFRDGAFVPRLLLPLSLSYDHRVIDGALAARFTTFLGQTLADPRGLMEAVL